MIFNATGSPGRVAIYTNGSDAPMTNPLGNLSRTKFHSDLDYIPFVPARTINATLTTPVSVASRTRTINLGAHGQAGIPFVFGYVVISGEKVPLCGSVPVYHNASFGSCVWWNLAVSGANVIIAELRTFPNMQSVTRTLRVYVSSTLAA